MLKSLTLLAMACCASMLCRAQLDVGDLAPDWTYTDINGAQHHLYDYLDSGYTVIIDVSATWCDPCWQFHGSGAGEALTEHYGPNGTIMPKKIKFFLFEGDPSTNLADLQGTGTSTWGDWIGGTNYPIIDNAAIMADYDLTGFPAFFTICPNKHIVGKDIGYGGSMGTEGYWTGYMNACPTATALHDAAVESLSADADVCNPAVTFQNMGATPITAATVAVYSGSTLVATAPFTGNVPTYGLATVSLPGFTPAAASGMLRYTVTTASDANAANDTVSLPYSYHALSSGSLRIEVRTDAYAKETSWALYDGATEIGSHEYSFTDNNSTSSYTYPVAPGACLRFEVKDTYGDGLTSATPGSTTDDGAITFYDGAATTGFYTIAGADFQTERTANFQAAGGTGIAMQRGIAGGLSLVTYPNPATGAFSLTATGLQPGSAAVTITDATGRIVSSLTGQVSGGVLQVRDVNAGGWAAGVYRVAVRQAGSTVGANVSVVK